MLVYLTFLLHGMAILLPWNIFITAGDVRISFRKNENKYGGEIWLINCLNARFYDSLITARLIFAIFLQKKSTLTNTSWVR